MRQHLVLVYSQVYSTLLEDYSDRTSSVLYHASYAPMEWDLDEHVSDFNVGHTFTYGKNTFKAGAQALFWDMKDMQGYKYRDKEEEEFGFFITDQYRVNQNLSFDLGGRIDRRHTIKQSDSKFNDTWAENNSSVAVGLAYRFNPIYKLTSRISYSEQPSYDWLLKVDENESFDSDKRIKYEAGITANYSAALNLGCTLFYYDIQNYKYVYTSVSNSDTGETDYYYDSADLMKKGFEISINGQLFDNFSYTATYSFLDVDDDDVSKTLPEYSATLILNYKYRAYHFNVTTQYLSEYSQSSTKGDGLGDYITIDASISKHLTDTSN